MKANLLILSHNLKLKKLKIVVVSSSGNKQEQQQVQATETATGDVARRRFQTSAFPISADGIFVATKCMADHTYLPLVWKE